MFEKLVKSNSRSFGAFGSLLLGRYSYLLSMISSVNVVSSADISDEGFLSSLREIGVAMGVKNFDIDQKIYDGVSNVWVRQSKLSSDEYEEEDIQHIESLLSSSAKSIVVIEYDDGETAAELVLHIVSQLSKRFPVVLDNCYGRIYRAEEIQGLILKGTF